MSGVHSGVASRLQKMIGHAKFIHCRSHNLSLAVMGKQYGIKAL